MAEKQSPKAGANITLIARDSGQRVQGQFAAVLGADWQVTIKKADVPWFYRVSMVELNFIMHGQVCTAKAEVGAAWLKTEEGREYAKRHGHACKPKGVASGLLGDLFSSLS